MKIKELMNRYWKLIATIIIILLTIIDGILICDTTGFIRFPRTKTYTFCSGINIDDVVTKTTDIIQFPDYFIKEGISEISNNSGFSIYFFTQGDPLHKIEQETTTIEGMPLAFFIIAPEDEGIQNRSGYLKIKNSKGQILNCSITERESGTVIVKF